MGDEHLRRLERAAKTGDPRAADALGQHLRRMGVLEEWEVWTRPVRGDGTVMPWQREGTLRLPVGATAQDVDRAIEEQEIDRPLAVKDVYRVHDGLWEVLNEEGDPLMKIQGPVRRLNPHPSGDEILRHLTRAVREGVAGARAALEREKRRRGLPSRAGAKKLYEKAQRLMGRERVEDVARHLRTRMAFRGFESNVNVEHPGYIDIPLADGWSMVAGWSNGPLNVGLSHEDGTHEPLASYPAGRGRSIAEEATWLRNIYSELCRCAPGGRPDAGCLRHGEGGPEEGATRWNPGDEEIRRLERASCLGDPAADRQLARERQRRGQGIQSKLPDAVKRAFKHFHGKTGGIVGEAARTALDYARAEHEGRERGWTVMVVPDEFDREFNLPTWAYLIHDRGGNVLASLGLVDTDDPRSGYGRQVAAELMWDALREHRGGSHRGIAGRRENPFNA